MVQNKIKMMILYFAKKNDGIIDLLALTDS